MTSTEIPRQNPRLRPPSYFSTGSPDVPELRCSEPYSWVLKHFLIILWLLVARFKINEFKMFCFKNPIIKQYLGPSVLSCNCSIRRKIQWKDKYWIMKGFPLTFRFLSHLKSLRSDCAVYLSHLRLYQRTQPLCLILLENLCSCYMFLITCCHIIKCLLEFR